MSRHAWKRSFASNWGNSMHNWERTTLGAICESSGGGIQTGPFGSQLHASDYVQDGTPSVMPQNIGDNRIDPTGIARVSASDIARLSRYTLRAGDIVYSRRGDVERRALVRTDNEGWLCGTGCLRVRIGDQRRYDSRFISYALGIPESRKWIKRHAVGATMLNLNTSILSAVPLLIPPISEQHAIAEVLQALDDKIAANDQIIAKVKDLLAAEFVSLQENSENELVPIGELVELNPKVQKPDAKEPVYLDMRNLPDQTMTVTSWSRRSPRGGARFQNGDTLLARITPCLENGKVGYVDFLMGDEVGLGSTEFIVMRPRKGIPTVFPYFLATDATFREFAIKRMVGTSGRQRLSAGDIVSFQVRRPSERDLARFSELSDALMGRVKAAVDETRALATARDELLPLLMSGKVRVREAEEIVEGVV